MPCLLGECDRSPRWYVISETHKFGLWASLSLGPLPPHYTSPLNTTFLLLHRHRHHHNFYHCRGNSHTLLRVRCFARVGGGLACNQREDPSRRRHLGSLPEPQPGVQRTPHPSHSDPASGTRRERPTSIETEGPVVAFALLFLF